MNAVEPGRLRPFVAVAEELNFRRASERLNIAQPALSRAIRALEERVGCALFQRTSRRVDLTDAGRAMLESARLAVYEADRAFVLARETMTGSRGHLALAYTHASISGPLPEIVTAFRKSEPQVRLEMQEMWTDWQAVALLERRIDVGFAMPAVLRPETEYLEVKAEPWVVVTREDHPLSRLDRVPLMMLRDEGFIMGTIDRWRHFREMITEMTTSAADFVPRVVHEESEIHAILGLVASGAGIMIYPECIGTYLRIGLAVRPLLDDLPPVRTVCAWRKDNSSPELLRFVQSVRTMAASEQWP